MAQTCSQIGADTGSNKLLADKSGSSNGGGEAKNKRSPALIVSDPLAKPVSFKPYESKSPKSVVSLSPTGSSSNRTSPKTTNGLKSPSPNSNATKDRRSSSSGSSAHHQQHHHPHLTNGSAISTASATPVIRSGMEVLAGHKDLSASIASSFRLPSTSGSIDPANPAFRPPFGLPPSSMAASVCRDPYCRDPACPTAAYNAQLAAAAAASLSGLPPGYAELLQAQKHLGALSALHGATSTAAASTTPATTSTATTTAAAASSPAAGAYICNWMNGREGYCGKRHNSADELLQHLRTHTNLSTSDASASQSAASSAAVAAAAAASLYPPGLFNSSSAAAAAAAGLHRNYGSLSANRFHPYAGAGAPKPPAVSAASAGSSLLAPSLGLGALGVPPVPPAIPPSLGPLAAAYSPSLFALYGSRLAGGSLP